MKFVLYVAGLVILIAALGRPIKAIFLLALIVMLTLAGCYTPGNSQNDQNSGSNPEEGGKSSRD